MNGGRHFTSLPGTAKLLAPALVGLTKIHAVLGHLICQSLPGYHAITGCDFNLAFFRKGKLKPYKTLKKIPEYQEAFKNFGTSELIENTDEQQNVFNMFQRFISNAYNAGNIIDVEIARLQMFIDLCTISDVNEALIERSCEILTVAIFHLAKVSYCSSFCEQTIYVPFRTMLI
ncbi:uncharacterized protein TNCV_1464181 [Trichonephila clavipes]|nr:uncharacterized protein TNCV_1464181 [Trichonephila clavipes]